MDANTVKLLINTLCKITISGKENMGMMLGCIKVLETELAKIEEAQKRDTGTNEEAVE